MIFKFIFFLFTLIMVLYTCLFFLEMDSDDSDLDEEELRVALENLEFRYAIGEITMEEYCDEYANLTGEYEVDTYE